MIDGVGTNIDGHEWEIIENPQGEGKEGEGVEKEGDKGLDKGEEKEDSPGAGGFSSHFDLKLGWGRYKVTVLSWDLKVNSAGT